MDRSFETGPVQDAQVRSGPVRSPVRDRSGSRDRQNIANQSMCSKTKELFSNFHKDDSSFLNRTTSHSHAGHCVVPEQDSEFFHSKAVCRLQKGQVIVHERGSF